MKKINGLLFFVICCVFQASFAQVSPVPMLEATANQIIKTLKHNQSKLKSNPKIVYQAVERYLLPNVDVAGMSRSVLGRQVWSKATSAERLAFSKAFTQLVIRTYASPLSEYTDEKIKFLPLRAGSAEGRFVRVSSLVLRSKGNIPLNYSLVFVNGQWKIYDLTVEGVSLLQSFRSQFAHALQQSDLQSVIREMNARRKVN